MHMLPSLAHAQQFLDDFAREQVPLIAFCQPQLESLDEQHVTLRIPLSRETKNHLGSMYFGALAIGADLAGGILALLKAQQAGHQISLAFKDVSGEFIKRPEADVLFTCRDGELIDNMLQQAISSGERINQPVTIIATCPERHQQQPMARFTLTLSLKVAQKAGA